VTTAPVRRGRPGHSRDSLLDVAVAAFNERGYDATSMEELAGRLGITKSAIYHHVPGKGELLRLALDRALDALFAVLDEPEAQSGPAISRLEHVVRASVRVLSEELPFVTLLLRCARQLAGRAGGAATPPGLRPDRHRTGPDGGAGGRRAAGRRPRGDQPVVVRHGQLAGGMVSAGSGLDAAALADAVVSTMFDGLRTRSR
jgi:AcrR family transcriptional regulator